MPHSVWRLNLKTPSATTINQRFMEYRARNHKDFSSLIDRLLYKDEKELMDSDDVPLKTRIELVQSLSDLCYASGYYQCALNELDSLIKNLPEIHKPAKQYLRIIDIGVGGGGLLKVIDQWAKRRNIPVELHGLDLSADFVTFTKSYLENQGIPVQMIQGNACHLENIKDESYDVVICNFMVHHLRVPSDVAAFFSEVHRIARQGWLIGDLDRSLSSVALSWMANKVYHVHPALAVDSMRSVRRAYSASEINFILDEIRKSDNNFNMRCRRHFFPYWLVKGTKEKSPLLK
jgi:2-polyprenyl-3-methyl-5-hydroxy-6-metoxy-1,4-benzoquinol methylase